MNTFTPPNNVKALRRWMAEEKFDAFVVPTIDPHNSEYPPGHWKAREWLTGFTGSAGVAVVTAEQAALWTDSRYFLQAGEQLRHSPFTLMRDGLPDTPSVADWLTGQLPDGGIVGFSGEMMTQELYDELLGGLDEKFGARASDTDPFRFIWEERPALPCAPVWTMPDELAGATAAEKLRRVFDVQHAACPDADYFLLNDLSEIAWALNLRGGDIDFTPVFLSYLIVGAHRAVLFTDERRLPPELKSRLLAIGVSAARYNGWKNFIEDCSADTRVAFSRDMNLRVVELCRQSGVSFSFTPWQVPMLKAVKTEAEQNGFRKAMLRDGRAMVRFLRWLEEAVPQGAETETSVARRLAALRAEEEGFKELSFATIAGYGPHGAIVHYEAEDDTAFALRPEGLLLLDSGAHYDCGTTDITRTIPLGPVTAEERRVYTLVLKGHIALSRSRFPEGTTGIQLDLAARYAMWQEGYDFGHGTGHGVGHCLCVHEGPQQIRKNLRTCTTVPFRAGMTVTDEPGIYVPGGFGVRIENTLLTVPDGETDFGKFLKFEPLTLCPIELSCADLALLNAVERRWIDDYHATVCAALLPLLTDEADRRWLQRKTVPVGQS